MVSTSSSYDKNLFNAVENEVTSSVTDILHELTQKTEPNLKSVINQRNEQNQTPLHIACSKLHSDITQILLEAGADPNVQDGEGRTPCFGLIVRLQECNCEDCMKKAIRCVAILAYHGASLDIPNQSGTTPLWLCAEYRFAECAKALLENGAALGTAKGKAMVEILVEKIPAVLETVFDRAVRIRGNKTIHDGDYEMTFDLGTVLPPQIALSKHVGSSNGHINQVFPADQWFKSKYEASEEMTFLKELLDYSENDVTAYKTLLRHPLVNVFTDIKWKSLECLYVLFLVLQIVVLLAYSAFIFVTVIIDCPYDLHVNLQKGLDKLNEHVFPEGSAFNATQIINPDQLCEINIISKILSVFVTLCTLLILLKEGQHAMYDLKAYLKDFFNYFQLIGFLSVIYTVIIAWNQKSPLYMLLYPVSAFGITISWCQLFVQIGRLPHLAIYVEMFVKISVNFCLSLAIYSSLLIGFAMSYGILFPVQPKFLNFPLSMIKVLSMLVGELDHDGLFDDSDDDKGSMTVKNETIMTTLKTMATKHKFAAYVWYVTFVVFITLVLMNLLVGLAVSDIQGIKKNAEIYVIKRRIRYIAYLEKILFEATACLPQAIKKFFRENVAIARSKEDSSKFLCCFNFFCNPVDLKNCKLTVRPNDPKDKLLSNESKMSIRHWVLSKSISTMTRNCAGGRGGSGASMTTGFRQRNLANFRKGSTSSFVALQQQIFVKDQATQGISDTERLKRLEFNVQQIDKKMNELDLKLEMILKTVLRPDTPNDV